MGFFKKILNEIQGNETIASLVGRAKPGLRNAINGLVDTCEKEQGRYNLASGQENDQIDTSILYNVKECHFSNQDKSLEEKLNDGSILYPKSIYNVNFLLREKLIQQGFKIAEDTGALIDFNGNIARGNNMDYSDEFIKSLHWEHMYNGWNKSGGIVPAEPNYISDKNVYVSRMGLYKIPIPSGVQDLTEPINDALLALPLEKRKLYLHAMNYSDWHIYVARAFITIKQLPAYGDGRKELGERVSVSLDGKEITPAGRGGNAISVDVDHMNGIHEDNSLNNLRVVRKTENIVASQVYSFYAWDIMANGELPYNVYIRLEYTPNGNATQPMFYCDNDYSKPVPEEIMAMIQVNKPRISNSQNENASKNKSFGILPQGINSKTMVAQIPIMVGFKDGSVKKAESAEAVANDLHMNVKQVYGFVDMSVKHNSPEEIANISDDSIIYMHYCTNQTLKEATNPPLEDTSDIESSINKKISNIENATRGTDVQKQNIIDILEYLTSSENYNIDNTEGNFIDYRESNGSYSITSRDSSFGEYLDATKTLDGEIWFAGLYVDLRDKGNIARNNSFNVLVSQEAKHNHSRLDYTRWGHLVAYNKIDNSNDKLYYIEVSNYGRIARWDDNRNQYRILSGNYFGNDYPSASANWCCYSFDLKSKTLVKGGYKKNSNDKLGSFLVNDKSARYHNLVASTLKFNEFVALLKEYGKVKSSDNSLMVHHIDEDISNFSPNNVEWVSGRENTLFAAGLTYMVAFLKEGTKEIPILGWPLENGSARGYYKGGVKEIHLPGGRTETITLPNYQDASDSFNKSYVWSPDKLYSENTGIIFRECVARDLRFTIASPEAIAKQVLFVILHKHGGTLSENDTIQLFSVDGDVSYFDETQNEGQQNGFVMTYGDYLKYKGEQTRYFNPSQETGKDKVNAKYNQALYEFTTKVKGLMDKIK